MAKKLVLLGVGNTARAVAQAVERLKFSSASNYTGYDEVLGTTRSVEKMPQLEEANISPVFVDSKNFDALTSDGQTLLDALDSVDTDILVSYPPNPIADEFFAAHVKRGSALVYISSTGVYGKLTGHVDENSPVDLETPSSVSRLKAEDTWRNAGAVILRAPGLYSSSTGMITRLRSGAYRLPGDGSNFVSRIHLDDLAKIILAAFRRANPATTYVVGDARPATHLEVATWLCRRLGIPVPHAIPLHEAHETLRGNRQIRAEKVLRDLDVTLSYPTFKEGYSEAFFPS